MKQVLSEGAKLDDAKILSRNTLFKQSVVSKGASTVKYDHEHATKY